MTENVRYEKRKKKKKFKANSEISGQIKFISQ